MYNDNVKTQAYISLYYCPGCGQRRQMITVKCPSCWCMDIILERVPEGCLWVRNEIKLYG